MIVPDVNLLAYAVHQESPEHRRARSNLTTDAHLAATCIERGATLHSADNDFARFRTLRWVNPLSVELSSPGHVVGEAGALEGGMPHSPRRVFATAPWVQMRRRLRHATTLPVTRRVDQRRPKRRAL